MKTVFIVIMIDEKRADADGDPWGVHNAAVRALEDYTVWLGDGNTFAREAIHNRGATILRAGST